MTSFDDLLKFSNSMSLKRPEELDPMAAAIWHSLVQDYYAGLSDEPMFPYGGTAKLNPPGITMRTMNLPTS